MREGLRSLLFRSGLIVLALSGSAALPAPAEPAEEPPALSPVAGFEIPLSADWDLVVNPRPAPLNFLFPDGAKQGPKLWWVGDLSFEISADPAGEIGTVDFDCYTGDWSFLLLQLERSEDGLEARIYDAVDGDRVIPLGDGPVSFRFREFLRDQGVLPGNVPFRCEPDGLTTGAPLPNIGLRSVRLLPDSRIYATSHSPTPAELDARLQRMNDGRVRVLYEVTSQDSRRLGDVRVSLIVDPAIQVEGEKSREFSDVDDRAAGAFLLTIDDYSPHRVSVGAMTQFNTPAMHLDISPRSRGAPLLSRLVPVFGLIVMAIGFLSLRRRPTRE